MSRIIPFGNHARSASQKSRPSRRRSSGFARWRDAAAAVALGALALIGLTAITNIDRGFAQAVAARDDRAGVRVRAIDGDTVAVIGGGERIRLPNIDAPETGDRARCAAERQTGAEATAFVRAAVAGKPVSLRRIGLDRYGRTLAYVSVDGRDLGDAVIAAGLARRWSGRRTSWC
ncbi:MAG: thermonuclease family protein [Hyphomonadaceae bacterium]|nr:thermonuclease family protein [Hyphomonadaceae bacterium]